MDPDQEWFDFDGSPQLPNSDCSADHLRFQSHLEKSEPARWLVGRWLADRGYTVQMTGTKKAPHQNQWKSFVDVGDIQITMRVEAKQLDCDFTCRADWPFGEDFIVCGRNSFDRARPKPYAYVILNRAGTHAAFVLTVAWKKWRIDYRKDSRYANVKQQYYFAPLESVAFAPLAAHQRSADKK